MATYSKSVLDALTENPAQLFVDFLKFLESTQPITVPSTSAIRVTSSAPTITIPGIQPSAGWIQLGRKGGVWRDTCPVPYVNLYTTCICCKVRKFNLKFFIQNIIIVF
ncbi:uncharacterized protein LOC124812493 isoform X5 [Hydra vulgaris]|uniref:uncharacterized protein LOC124812493 isoform X5 n=1 Tax=Hydra vulgaris TaxID=6087 RepID=UPI0032EA4972